MHYKLTPLLFTTGIPFKTFTDFTVTTPSASSLFTLCPSHLGTHARIYSMCEEHAEMIAWIIACLLHLTSFNIQVITAMTLRKQPTAHARRDFVCRCHSTLLHMQKKCWCCYNAVGEMNKLTRPLCELRHQSRMLFRQIVILLVGSPTNCVRCLVVAIDLATHRH